MLLVPFGFTTFFQFVETISFNISITIYIKKYFNVVSY